MIQAFGALDTFFAPMYYEDAAWQYNLHRQGIRTVLNSRTSIIHAEGSTAGTSITTGMKRYQEINRKKFLSRFSEADILRANTVL
jgi:GT2 family glycosyltransferase